MKYKNQTILVINYSLSTLSHWTIRIITPLSAYELTNSPFITALTYAANYASYVITLLISGISADYISKKKF